MDRSASRGYKVVTGAWILRYAAVSCCLFLCCAEEIYAQDSRLAAQPVVYAVSNPGPTVSPVTGKSLRGAIKSYHGKVILLNFWATYCPTCVDEFPALVRTSERFKKDGLIVLAVSADSPDDVDAKVRPFLRRNHVTGKTYLLTEDPDTFIPNFDRTWLGGGLPRTYVFDRQGKFRFVTSEGQTEASLAHLIKPYL